MFYPLSSLKHTLYKTLKIQRHYYPMKMFWVLTHIQILKFQIEQTFKENFNIYSI